jgi:hypothetical protein
LIGSVSMAFNSPTFMHYTRRMTATLRKRRRRDG